MKLQSQHLLTAIFLLFIFAITASVFVPNITAAATVEQQTDGMPVILLWALPVLVIVAVIMYCSHRAVCASKVSE